MPVPSPVPALIARGVHRRLAAFAALALGILFTLVATASPSSAHAVLESTSPQANSTVATAPTAVTLKFSAPVSLPDQLPQLFDAAGKVVAVDPAEVVDGGQTITFGVPQLADGTYTVTWRAISEDSHTIRGAFTFNVGKASATTVDSSHLLHSGSTSKAVGVFTGVLRAIAFASYIIAVGSLLFVAVCTPHLAGTRRAQLLTAVALFVLGVAAIAQCFALHSFTSGGNLGDIVSFKHFRDSLGRDDAVGDVAKALVWRFGLCLVGIVAFSRHRLPGHKVLGLTMVGTWVAALTATFAVVGHPRSGRWQTLAVFIDGSHLVAAAAWVGGLVALISLVLIVAESPEHRSAAQKFSTIAATSVAVVAATGAVQAVRQLTAVSDLWSETYGRLLSVKLAAVGLILLVAARSRWLTKGEDGDHKQLRTMVAVETIGAIVVVSVTALLVNSPPPYDTQRTPVADTVAAKPATATATTNGYSFAVTLDPGTSGPTSLMVVATKDGKPVELFEFHATLKPESGTIDPIDVEFDATGNMYMSKDLTVPFAGKWTLSLRVLTGPIDQFETSTTITVT